MMVAERDRDPVPPQGPITVAVDPMLLRIVPGYLLNRQADVNLILAALANGDFAAVGVIGHGMKGSGGSYGFAELTRFGVRLESAALLQDARQCRQLAEDLQNYLAAIRLTATN